MIDVDDEDVQDSLEGQDCKTANARVPLRPWRWKEAICWVVLDLTSVPIQAVLCFLWSARILRPCLAHRGQQEKSAKFAHQHLKFAAMDDSLAEARHTFSSIPPQANSRIVLACDATVRASPHYEWSLHG